MNLLSPDEIFGELFIAMNKSGLWEDDKAIADAIPKATPKEILNAYQNQKGNTGFDLKAFADQYFEFTKAGDSGFVTNPSKTPQEHIETLWNVLKRTADQPREGSSLIPLPHPYIVPGGRFNEIYYWDSYFTMLGLEVSQRWDIIEAMIDNFSYLIDTFGFVPNGNRTYFLGRSQPPFYALMIELLAKKKGDEVYKKYGSFLNKELVFWSKEEFDDNDEVLLSRAIPLGGEDVLYRYWDDFDTPRQEMYATDLAFGAQAGKNAPQLFRDLRSACESGWDFSSRWLRDENDLSTIHTSEIFPVDLNCLVYQLKMTTATALRVNGSARAAKYTEADALEQKNLIQKYFWNSAYGYYMDYDFVKQEHKNVYSLAGMYPLFFKIATKEQADKCAKIIETKFLKAGGLTSTANTTTLQWDAPNGWAPLQWVAIQGLRNYGFHQLANEVKKRWVDLNTKVYKSTGKMLEKYNVVDVDLETGGGEYPVQDGFGWTNGVLLRLLSE
jgi:alpha,alpha-trehalase